MPDKPNQFFYKYVEHRQYISFKYIVVAGRFARCISDGRL